MITDIDWIAFILFLASLFFFIKSRPQPGTLMFHLSREAVDHLRQIQARHKTYGLTDVIKMALSVYDAVTASFQNGEKVVFIKKDGRQIPLTGVKKLLGTKVVALPPKTTFSKRPDGD
jgi:hypothetical protein